MNIITENIDSIVTWLTIIVVLIAIYTDLRWRKIFNRLTFPAAIIGLLLHIVDSGWDGFLFCLIGLTVGLVIFIVPFVFGRMGGGDVKLMGALGTLVGGYGIVNIALLTAIVGGFLAIAIALYNNKLKDTFYKAWILVRNIIKPNDETTSENSIVKSIKMPYGLAIGGGTFCFLIVGRII
jgi:prepilin peptidase CpaA